ncbi:alpha-galactosidase [uncultured Devosia sp.]|uniref:alpha-galactosidase n=1 Tax=uncultured Devosia sp. TaxID=211434 RepID=UPI0035CBD81C
MTKIAMIGAGSVVFVKKLLADMMAKPELRNATIALHDINAERLETAGMMARWTAEQFNAKPIIEEHLDRRACIAGADFVINTVMIGGVNGMRTDFETAARYGLKQTVADTVGIGGIMRGLRTIPFVLQLCEELAELAPNAYLLNYSNPMSMITWAVYRAFPNQKVIGLCHNVQHTAGDLAEYLGVEPERLSFDCAGINHMTWFLRLEVDGKDAYPALRRAAERPEIVAKDRVRFEIFKQFGWFVSESSRHFAEYVPYFLKSDSEIQRLQIPIALSIKLAEERGERYALDRAHLLAGGGFEFEKSVEYGAEIIHSVVTNTPILIYGNIENQGHITNLPDGACVEVPVVVDRNGFRGCYAGELPPELAAHCAPHVFVQDLVGRAVIEQDPELVYRAAMLDRHAPSVLTIDQIRALVDELLAIHAPMLPLGLRPRQLQKSA